MWSSFYWAYYTISDIETYIYGFCCEISYSNIRGHYSPNSRVILKEKTFSIKDFLRLLKTNKCWIFLFEIPSTHKKEVFIKLLYRRCWGSKEIVVLTCFFNHERVRIQNKLVNLPFNQSICNVYGTETCGLTLEISLCCF